MTRKRTNMRRLSQGIETLETRKLLAADILAAPMDVAFEPAAIVQTEDVSSRSGPVARIVNGQSTSDFAAVGIVNNGCTGTLIAPNAVLTAGHCIEDMSATSGTFEVGGKTYATANMIAHPNYNGEIGNDNSADIAIMILQEDVTGIVPMQINRTTPEVGQLLTLVGFGGQGTGSAGHDGSFGNKNVGTTPVDEVSPGLISWRFDNESESNTAPGDSGGPAFLSIGGVQVVAGVTSGGDRNDAGIGDHSFDTRVDAYASWIDSVLQGGATPSPEPGDGSGDQGGSGGDQGGDGGPIDGGPIDGGDDGDHSDEDCDIGDDVWDEGGEDSEYGDDWGEGDNWDDEWDDSWDAEGFGEWFVGDDMGDWGFIEFSDDFGNGDWDEGSWDDGAWDDGDWDEGAWDEDHWDDSYDTGNDQASNQWGDWRGTSFTTLDRRDVNRDGVVGLLDGLQIVGHMQSADTASDTSKLDINSDERVNVRDLMEVVNYLHDKFHDLSVTDGVTPVEAPVNLDATVNLDAHNVDEVIGLWMFDEEELVS